MVDPRAGELPQGLVSTCAMTSARLERAMAAGDVTCLGCGGADVAVTVNVDGIPGTSSLGFCHNCASGVLARAFVATVGVGEVQAPDAMHGQPGEV
jgi:hypothetical protein